MKVLIVVLHSCIGVLAMLSAASAGEWKSPNSTDPMLLAPAIVQPAPSALTAYSYRTLITGAPIRYFDGVSLTWKDNSTNEYTYRVERCAGATCTNFVEIAKLPANTTRYGQIFAVSPGKIYRYRVRTRGPYGFSAYTKIVNVTLR